MSMILYSTEAIEGHSFLEVSNYDLFVEHDSDGMPYLVLVRDNDDDSVHRQISSYVSKTSGMLTSKYLTSSTKTRKANNE